MRSFCVVLASIACLASCGEPVRDSLHKEVVLYEAASADGSPISLASLRGEAVLLNVWATWCGPCREEIPFLASLQAKKAASGLRVVGVSVDAMADREKVLQSAAMLGLTYDLWLDPEERIGGVLRYAGLPASMLVNREGVVVWKHVGVLRETTPGFSEALEQVLSTRTET
jgi:thiol-disulfide isomerase/thioredoxin